jgi:hypothetical protein
VIEDLAGSDPLLFGSVGRVWFGGARGLKPYDYAAVDPDSLGAVARILDGLRSDATAELSYRTATEQASMSRQAADRLAKMGEALTRTAASRADLIQTLTDLADRFGPSPGMRGASMAEVTSLPAQPLAVRPTVGKAD